MATVYNLTGPTGATDWMDLSSVQSAFVAQLKITGTLTVVLETSCDPANASHTDAATAETYTVTPPAKVIDMPLPRFIRYRCTSGSGTAIVSFGRAIDAKGNWNDVPAQPTSNSVSDLL